MKTLKKVEVQPVYVEYIPETLEENKIYISKEYNTAIHLCLCGCKKLVVTPLNHRYMVHGWNLIEEHGKVSLSPSIGNFQYECKSHYILTKNIANFV